MADHQEKNPLRDAIRRRADQYMADHPNMPEAEALELAGIAIETLLNKGARARDEASRMIESKRKA